MAWTIITIYTSKCAQMDPQQLQRQNFITDAKSVTSKNLRGVPPPLVARKLRPHKMENAMGEIDR